MQIGVKLDRAVTLGGIRHGVGLGLSLGDEEGRYPNQRSFWGTPSMFMEIANCQSILGHVRSSSLEDTYFAISGNSSMR